MPRHMIGTGLPPHPIHSTIGAPSMTYSIIIEVGGSPDDEDDEYGDGTFDTREEAEEAVKSSIANGAYYSRDKATVVDNMTGEVVFSRVVP